MQTRKGSFLEAWTNIFVGGSINWIATISIVPILWNPASPKLSSLYMTVFYTGISLIRSYCLRRWFNGLKFGNKAPADKGYVLARRDTPDCWRVKPEDLP